MVHFYPLVKRVQSLPHTLDFVLFLSINPFLLAVVWAHHQTGVRMLHSRFLGVDTVTFGDSSHTPLHCVFEVLFLVHLS